MVPSLPVTALNGVTTFAGRGFDPKTMDARLTMHLSEFMVDSTQVTEAVVVAAAREARVTVDSLRVRTPFASATATGTFGLDERSDGTLTYGVDVTNLSGLQRWIATHDTSMVYSRSLVRQRVLDRAARADSLRAVSDSATLVSALASGQGRRRPARLPRIQAADSLRRDSSAERSVSAARSGRVTTFTAQVGQRCPACSGMAVRSVAAHWSSHGRMCRRLTAPDRGTGWIRCGCGVRV
jgi:hypothetical protein